MKDLKKSLRRSIRKIYNRFSWYYLFQTPDESDSRFEFCIINPTRCINLLKIRRYTDGDWGFILLNFELIVHPKHKSISIFGGR